jgi:hypothetical protein
MYIFKLNLLKSAVNAGDFPAFTGVGNGYEIAAGKPFVLHIYFYNGFKEIPATNNEDFSFDYAMEMPGKDFEVWFQVKSQKENWASYERAQNDKGRQVANPDSLYVEMGKAHAIAFTGDNNYFIRNMPQNVLERYNADAGKSYLLNLLDLPSTKHYKYALLITLQRNHTGTIMMVCFTNEKDPEFFKNIDKAGNCLKFKS